MTNNIKEISFDEMSYDFESSVFQVFKDNNSSSVYPKIYLEYDEEKFKEINECGGGIFFTPNGCSGGRKLKNLIKLNAVFADIDISKEGDSLSDIDRENKKREIFTKLFNYVKPHYIIVTKNGIQPLFLIDCELTKENIHLFTYIENGIINWTKNLGCKGDQVKDVVRVIRLPNFYHIKNPKEPFLVKAYKTYSGDRYSLKYLNKIFPFEEERKYIGTQEESKPRYTDERARYIVEKLNINEVFLKALSGIGRVGYFDEKDGRLYIDDRKNESNPKGVTGTYSGFTKGYGSFIGSSSGEDFSGDHFTSIMKVKNITKKEAFEWICETFDVPSYTDLKKNDIIKKINEVKKEDVDLIYKKFMPYTFGTDLLDEKLPPVEKHHKILIVGKTGCGKTSYSIDMAIKNAKLCHKVLFLSLEMPTDNILTRIAREYAGITKTEWRNKEIPKVKEDLYFYKKKQIESIQNLHMGGLPVGESANINFISAMIESSEKYDLIFIDNFDLIDVENRPDSERGLVISNYLMRITNEKKIPIVMLHHFKKDESTVDKPLRMNTIRGSGKIGDGFDTIIQVWRQTEEIPEDSSELRVILMKDRDWGYSWQGSIFFDKGSFFDKRINL
jgi:hypothetical protein